MLVASAPVYQPAVIPEPGAKISTQLPWFEYDAGASIEVVAPTVIAEGALDGE